MSESLSREPKKDVAPCQRRYAEAHEVVAEICLRLAEGEPLVQICRDAHMPSAMTVWQWTQSDSPIALEIARARQIGYDKIAVDAVRIVDGEIPARNAHGQELPPDANRDRARAQTRLQVLAKWDPKRYGESTQIRHADAHGEKLDTAPLVGQLIDAIRQGRTGQG